VFYSARLQKFRSYQDQVFEFEPGVNIIVGPNASGKTNLLEALYVLSRGKSFKVRDKDLIKHKKPWARLDADTDSGHRTVKIKLEEDKSQKEFEINSNISKRLKKSDYLPVVLFVPSYLRLLTGPPTLRRDYLDQLITQLHPERGQDFAHYQRALLQRNSLLKQPQADQDQLFVWNIKLGEYGTRINLWRNELINEINKRASKIYSEVVSCKTKIKFIYINSVSNDYASGLNSALNSVKDNHTGFTSVGPHREDFRVEIDGKDSSITASRGETRTLVLTAKIIELRLLEKQTRKKPLLLLDDVFSELDGARRSALTKNIANYQSIITTTDADSVVEHFLRNKTSILALK
jgi:DNA replication and repair protein RecF